MISFAYPAREHLALQDEIEQGVLRVLRSGRYILGPEVRALEQQLALWTGAPHVVSVSSGTDALACALTALGVRAGHEVLVPSFGFIAAPEAVIRVGAVPVFVDIEPASLGPSPSACAQARSAATRALIVMHLFGQAVDVKALQEALPGLPVIEDAAQAIGTRMNGQHVGLQGDVGTLSFFPAKSLGAAGDAGAVLTRREDLVDPLKSCRVHGAVGPYQWTRAGGNYRLDAVQAAVLQVKLSALEKRLSRRRTIGARLVKALRDGGCEPFDGVGTCSSTFAPLAARVPNREAFISAMRARDVDVRVQYPVTLPDSPGLAPYVPAAANFDNARLATQQLVSLPCSPELTDDEVDYLETSIRQVLAS